MPAQEPVRERDFDRFLTFLDAIVAIAVTLLVLPLVEITRESDEYETVGALLHDNLASIGAFALSFVIISQYWLSQHRAVRHVRVYHRRLATLLLVWSMSIVFLPFPTALVAERGSEAVVEVLYVGTLLVGTLSLTFVEGFVRRHPEVTDGERGGDPLDGLVVAFVMVVALVVMVLVPASSYFPMLLLVLADPLADGYRRLRGRPAGVSPVGE